MSMTTALFSYLLFPHFPESIPRVKEGCGIIWTYGSVSFTLDTWIAAGLVEFSSQVASTCSRTRLSNGTTGSRRSGGSDFADGLLSTCCSVLAPSS